MGCLLGCGMLIYKMPLRDYDVKVCRFKAKTLILLRTNETTQTTISSIKARMF